MGGAKVAMPTGPTPLDKTPPGSNQHPLSNKEEARTSEKEKPRVEDGSLDGVAARTAQEHVTVKQEPHIPSVSGAILCLTWLGGGGGPLVPLVELHLPWCCSGVRQTVPGRGVGNAPQA